MTALLTIGQLARECRVAGSTVRYYEREGLLQPEGRNASNYRVYGSASVQRLRFIRAAQISGLSLGDIRTLLEYQDGEVAPCADVRSVIEQRLGQVVRQLEDLQAARKTLEELRDACGTTAHGESCPALHKFRNDNDDN